MQETTFYNVAAGRVQRLAAGVRLDGVAAGGTHASMHDAVHAGDRLM